MINYFAGGARYVSTNGKMYGLGYKLINNHLNHGCNNFTIDEEAAPDTIDVKINAKSLLSFTGFLNLTIDIAPTRANALAIFEPIIIIMRVTVIPTKTIDWAKELEYEW